jgi:hypothetical protein
MRERRKAMLAEAHMQPLASYTKKLEGPGLQVPDFDPCDGGVKAQVLFLFEKPGPMTAEEGSRKRSGSGFISRDNDDPTAEAIWHFMRIANIPRELTALWNIIPWWNGTRAVEGPELRNGVSQIFQLLELLTEVTAVVLVGAKAASAMPLLQSTKLLTCSPICPRL